MTLCVAIAVLLIGSGGTARGDNPIRTSIASIQSVGPGGEGNEAAIQAAEHLRKLPIDELPKLFNGMKTDNPIARNWLRGIAADIVRRALANGDNANPDATNPAATNPDATNPDATNPDAAKGDAAPSDDAADLQRMLKMYVVDRTRNPHGRAAALDLWARQNPTAAGEFIDDASGDPSLLIRERAIAKMLVRADAAEGQSKADILRVALADARHPAQLQSIVRDLKEFDPSVTLGDALAMIVHWQCVAPFDNRGGIGFDTAYAPEQSFTQNGTVDLDAKYDGKNGPVVWQSIRGDADSGFVDIAPVYEKEKGAVAYLYRTFQHATGGPAQVRLTTKNASKIFLNGKPIYASRIYHSGSTLDQYVADCQLAEGENRLMIKLCQNEQTQPWAQEYQFQCRVTDPAGAPFSFETADQDN